MSALERLPDHLKKYVVKQDYNRYTPEDQAVWRFITRQLKDFLATHAHECYLEGLAKTGIEIEKIPHIEKIDRCLSAFGWGAVPVSGFIPPAAFMEFQSLGILPIACDMRSLDHLLYTPAPDIVHEAAGHAPILINREFADYLRKYAEVAKHAIISKEDIDQYNAIRELSDIKEHPGSTPENIGRAEELLASVNAKMKHVSEAALLSRMNWWTAEYGLIGDIEKPRIYGAGLLSSVGESRQCLGDMVKKIPLDIHCIDYSYDITEPQPQLFVAPDFQTLHAVLDRLAEKLSYRLGGVHGLDEAKRAGIVNTVQLNSGIQISGVLASYMLDEKKDPIFLRFSGPCQLSVGKRQLAGQGTARHPHGFSMPLGRIKPDATAFSTATNDQLANLGLRVGEQARIEYVSGIVVEGKLRSNHRDKLSLKVLTLNPCKVTLGTELLFDPAWGDFDLAVGETVTSVFAGPSDRAAYGDIDDFVASRVSPKADSTETNRRYQYYSQIRVCRDQRSTEDWRRLANEYLFDAKAPWLMGMELLEIGYALGEHSGPLFLSIKEKLSPEHFKDSTIRQTIEDGLRLAERLA